ncbi:hypothetical protein RBU49_10740 [Clostridium sp. MB40-C1]|uniref:hypothetical protein n=1 Tax=Clostridium sp. MB40-C1 TaxID=3070996 RepID=UPI0027DEC692|nr:hypothetical protein [Clostridium sp. MB40-C1]WMJ79366.1 hypothetical protein RBU49_10740 [Clostridium sp. MB40-C1]
MFKICKTLIVSLIIVLGISISCSAEEYTNFSNLVENNKSLDGKYITVKGEAIGEPMKRGNHTWINISDGSTSIGIWMENAQAEKVITFGSYKNKGDIIKTKVLFNKSCNEHDGEIDLHASQVQVIENGYAVNHFFSDNRMVLSIALSMITAVLCFIYFKWGRK